MSNQGKVTDPAATPFSTSDGKPITPTATSGAGAYDLTREGNRTQADHAVEGSGPLQPHQVNVPQRPAADPYLSERAPNLRDAGFGGGAAEPIVDAEGAVARGGTRGVTNAPMKLHNPPTFVTNPSSRSSPSSGSSSASRSSAAPSPHRRGR
jgi:hypothetical protein